MNSLKHAKRLARHESSVQDQYRERNPRSMVKACEVI